MANAVMLKSFHNGISVILDPDADFETIYSEMIQKFISSAKFFGKAKLVISFEGRKLSEEEEKYLVDCISENTDITVACIIGNDEDTDEMFIKAASSFSNNSGTGGGQFYKGSVKAGDNIETDSSLIILGDVNPGAKVSASGNIIILGTLYGHVHAGCYGDEKSFVVALDLKPTRIRIADVSERVGEKNGIFLKNKSVPKITYIKDGKMITDAITTDTLSNLPI